MDKRSRLLYIRLVFPEPEAVRLSPDQSWLLVGLSTYHTHEIYGFGAPGIDKDPSLGTVFDHLQPAENSSFTVELGAKLPDLLPNLTGQTEYWLDVPVSNDGADIQRVVLSNQMAQMRYRIDGREYTAIIPRAFVSKVRKENDLRIPNDVAVEPLTTMASTRCSISGSSAEEALETHLEDCAERFVAVLNQILSAAQMCLTDSSNVLTADYDRNTFDSFYVMMQGQDKQQLSHGRFALNLMRSRLNPPNLADIEAQRFLAYVNRETPISDVKKLLQSAKGFIDGGLLRQALLQAVIAAEIATRRYVFSALRATGVSRSKVTEVEREITYSTMLNVFLFSLAPVGMKPDRELIGTINAARSLRNKLMHEGVFRNTRDELLAIHAATDRFIQYLNQIASQQGLSEAQQT